MRKISSMLMLSMLLSCSNQGTLVTNNVTQKSSLSVDTTNKLPDNKVSIAQASATPVKKVEQINKVNDTKLVKENSLVSKNISLPQVSSSPTPSLTSSITVTSSTPIPTSTAIPSPTYTIDPDPYGTHLQTSPMTENDQNLVPIKESDKGQGHQATGTGDPRINEPLPSYMITPTFKRPYIMNFPLPSLEFKVREGDISVTFKDEYKIRLKTDGAIMQKSDGSLNYIRNANNLPIFISLTGENVDSVNNIVNKHKIDSLYGHQLYNDEKSSFDYKKQSDIDCGCDNPNELSNYTLRIKDDDIRLIIMELRLNPLVRECNFEHVTTTGPD